MSLAQNKGLKVQAQREKEKLPYFLGFVLKMALTNHFWSQFYNLDMKGAHMKKLHQMFPKNYNEKKHHHKHSQLADQQFMGLYMSRVMSRFIDHHLTEISYCDE